MLGVFLDRGSLDLGDLDFSDLMAMDIEWQMYEQTQPHEVVERIAEADIVITNKVVVDSAALNDAKNLKLICVAATGTNNVDLYAASAHSITVSNVRAYGTASVVQHVFTLLTALTTHLLDYQRDIQNGRWQRETQFCFMDHPIRELAGRTMGIVGYGELGRAVGKVAEAFGMKLLIAQRPGGKPQSGRVPLHEMLPQVDVLSLHCPLTDDTRDLIGPREFGLMRRDAILINAARGGIVDEVALAEALREGRLGGAGIDVLTQEPPTQGNILLEPDIPNLIVTPHIAWASQESRQRLWNQVVENISAYLAGTPMRVVE